MTVIPKRKSARIGQLTLPLWYNTNEYTPGGRIGMGAREAKGSEIAERLKITRNGDTWIVPSQRGTGKYQVRLDGGNPTCTCPDHELRNNICKHAFAVLQLLREEREGPKDPA